MASKATRLNFLHEGKRRPTNIVDEISKECDKYGDAHRMASESNSTLHSAMRLHIDNLKLLSLPLDQLQKEIPSLSDLDEESEANIAEVGSTLHQHHRWAWGGG